MKHISLLCGFIISAFLFSCEPVEDTLPGKAIIYTGDSLRNIAVPVGGIGTGDILIGGRGNIKAIEVFNRAAANDQPYMTFFSLWTKQGDAPSRVWVMEGILPDNSPGPYGVSRRQLSGLTRFDKAEFSSHFPFIHIDLEDDDIPLKINGEFFNPLIPLDVENSSFPVATFRWTLENTGNEEVRFAVAANIGNPLSNRTASGTTTTLGNTNEYFENGPLKGIVFKNQEAGNSPRFGNLVMASDFDRLDVQTAWYKGAWWDDATIFWDDFSVDGRLNERKEKVTWQGSNWYGSASQTTVGSLSAYSTLKPGEKITIPFYLSWYVPNRILESTQAFGNEAVENYQIKNHYATRFASSVDALLQFREKEDELYEQSRKFVDFLFNTTLPDYVIDAVSANTAALKTNLLMRTEEGWVHGFEGLGESSGCCPGNCTHVWNYAQTMAALFPELEQKVREVSFLHDTFDNGYQCFRTVFPLGDYWFKNVAADGQMGNIIRVYREWRNTGDTEWLKRLWPKVKAALEFAWKGSGEVSGKYSWQEHARIPWDPDKEGVMRGDQHNTYDINFFGPNMMTGSLYLGALKACSEMAAHLGEDDKAKEYISLYRNGLDTYTELLWNGEYFIQDVEVIEGIEIPERLKSPPDEEGRVIPKYQYADGCLTDQLLGQYLSFNAGLGFIIDKDLVKNAMSSVYDYNFIRDFSAFDNVQRVFALNDEAGIVICSWPQGDRPRLPFVYSDEVWTGIEYGAATNMIHAGLVDEALEVIEAVRNRYRGYNRNPWGEIESGMFYARSLAGWSVLPALSGFEFDGVKNYMAFDPKIYTKDFRAFWSCGTAWGNFSQNDNQATIKVGWGTLTLSSLKLPREKVGSVLLNGSEIDFDMNEDNILSFIEERIIDEGDSLVVNYNE